MQYRERLRLASLIRSARTSVAASSADHLEFLAAAIQSGEPTVYRDYTSWAAGVLESRGAEPAALADDLREIGTALQARVPGADGAVIDEFIAAGLEGCLAGAHVVQPSLAEHPVVAPYIDAAVSGKRDAALALILSAARDGRSIVDIYADILQTAMYRIGQMWELNQINVAQEHMATAITQFVMSRLYTFIDRSEPVSGKAVIAGVTGEYHQLGANMVADVLEANGWDVCFLGVNVPVECVIRVLHDHRADLLGISTTMVSNLANVGNLIDAVRSKAEPRIRILVGGAAFRSAPALYRELGADGCGLDVRDAIALAKRAR